jgi:3-hydroxyisobutyrate dehydrogenase
MSSKPRLLFVGVGNMGNPMAANLIRAGYPTTVFDVSRNKADNLIALGAHWADSLAAVQRMRMWSCAPYQAPSKCVR